MKVKLLNIHQLGGKLIIVKALHEIGKMGLKEAKDCVDGLFARGETELTIDVQTTKFFAEKVLDGLGINYVFVNDDKCPTHDQEADDQEAERKLQEITDDDLGVSIHSVDEMSIAWRCKTLFTHEQATRVIAGLHDAKLNVTEKLVMHKGNKVTMLTVSKTFPSGTRDADIKKFDSQLHKFAYYVCEVVNAEKRLEAAKERAIEAFNELRDYE